MDNILKQDMLECKVSIVVPCFNSGLFLPETLDSIRQIQYDSNYEVIIVDDGSTDRNTIDLLGELKQNGYIVLAQENLGPAAARNSGVKYAKGEYILFLDSDNKVGPSYISRAVDILDSNIEVGVVYGNASFFGDSTEPRFYGAPFDLKLILEGNYIDMCSVVRKRAWAEVGGLDESRILIGHEDWDFWIRIGAANWKFYHIPEVMFDYRVRNDSLVTNAVQPAKHQKMVKYVYEKHLELMFSAHPNCSLLLSSYRYLIEQNSYYQNDKNRPFRSFFKYLNNKYFARIF